jgi:photosystem II stability/assembly factor-like uncharacterized protein
MPDLLAATTDGIFEIRGVETRREDGPQSVHFLSRGPAAVYAVADDGALWRRAMGHWALLNSQPIHDEVWSFAADPHLGGRLYLGVSPAMFYCSRDEGSTWTACESVKRIPGYETWTFPPPPHIPHVRSIAPDPAVYGGVYIGVEEGGVYRSHDGGDTWEGLNEGLYWDVHTVVPAKSSHELYATTGAGFHYSADGGGHWTHVPLGHRYTVPLLAPPWRDGLLLTVTAEGPPPTWSQGVNGAVYRSEDAGRTWRRAEKGLPPALDWMASALICDDESCVYAAVGGSILVSDDAGESWRTLLEGLPGVRALVAI